MKLKQCKGCAGCVGCLHYYRGKYHFVLGKDADSDNYLLAVLDGKNKIVTKAAPREIKNFAKDFEKEMKECVEKLKSAEMN